MRFLLRAAVTAVGGATLAASVLASTACTRGERLAPVADGAVVTPVTVASAAPSAGIYPPTDGAAPGGFIKANVDYVLNPYNLAPYTGPTGSVEGTVTIDGPASPTVQVDASRCPAALDTYGKLFREGPAVKPGGARPLADAVVVVVGYSDYYVPETRDAQRVVISASCAYPSRTLAITYGQHLEIANDSAMLFAPMLDLESTPAVMAVPPRGNGDPVKVYPQKAGHFVMTDRLDAWVREDLYVFRHPLHAVTDKNGHYRIDGVPVGNLKVGVAHPGANASAEVPVDIKDGAVARTDVKLVYKPAAPPPPKPASSEVLPPWKRPNE